MDLEKQKLAISSVTNRRDFPSFFLTEEKWCDLQERFSHRRMACDKCSSFKGKMKLDGHKIATKKVVEKKSFLHLPKGQEVFVDPVTYFILSSWVCSSVCAGVVEVFDTWSCSKTRTYVLEDCEPYSEEFEREYSDQVDDILYELTKVGFKSRPLTKSDFFVRHVAFSFIDDRGKHRSGPVKICLKIPLESSFVVGETEVKNCHSLQERLYTCKELSDSS